MCFFLSLFLLLGLLTFSATHAVEIQKDDVENEQEEQNMEDEDEEVSDGEEYREEDHDVEDMMDKLEAFDSDGDQKVSLAEIKDLITKELNEQGNIPSDEQVEKFVESHMKIFRKVFPESDFDADGFIDKEEFTALMQRVEDEHYKEEEDEEQDMEDEDEQTSDGEEDRDEDHEEDDMLDKLEAFDADGDQKVSLAEIKDMITNEIDEEGVSLSDEEAEKYVEHHMNVFKKVFPKSDTDGDGFINKEEFTALMQNFDSEMDNFEDM